MCLLGNEQVAAQAASGDERVRHVEALPGLHFTPVQPHTVEELKSQVSKAHGGVWPGVCTSTWTGVQ